MIDAALAALDRGDAAPLRAAIADGELDLLGWQRAWHAASTIGGRVAGRLRIAQGDAVLDALLTEHPPIVAGGAPRTVADADQLARDLHAALTPAPDVETHRRAAASTLADLSAGRLPPWSWDAAAALLRHHTDLPVDVPARVPLLPGDGSAAAREAALLAPLLDPVLASPEAFARHLRRGRAAASPARRRLATRLLAR